jgi:hypothetical protein
LTTTDSGLKYRDTKIGEGALPEKGNSVRVHYTGTFVMIIYERYRFSRFFKGLLIIVICFPCDFDLERSNSTAKAYNSASYLYSFHYIVLWILMTVKYVLSFIAILILNLY